MRIVERTKVCTRCGEHKPWSAFYACKKWEDGTTRVPQSRCKACAHITRHIARKADPDQWRRHAEWQRYYHANLTDEQRAIKRDQDRTRRRRKNSIPPSRYRSSKYLRVVRSHERVPVEPFAAWIESVIERDGASKRATADLLRMPERMLRMIVGREQAGVELDTVERALIADGSASLDDLYPRLFAEAA